MSEVVEFWFHYGGSWLIDSFLTYEEGFVDIMFDDVKSVTYDHIVNLFSELGYSNVKKIFVLEPAKHFDGGLFPVNNEESLRKVLEYLKSFRWDKIEIFIDQSDDILSYFTPNILPSERPPRADDNTVFVDVDVGVEENLWAADEVNFGPSVGENLVGISVLENVKSLYISPVGFVSEEDEGDVSDSDGIADEDEEDGSSGTETEHDLGDEAPYSYSGQGCFDIGMTFSNAKEARDAINDYGVKFGFKLKFLKNEPSRLRVICLNEVGCPFKLFVSKDGNRGGLAVKTVVMEHMCFRQFKVPSASQHFLAKYFKNQIYKNPKFSVKDMQAEVEKHLKIYVSKDKCKRAKRSILHELDGSFKKEFGYLEAYVNAVIRENPGTITQIQFCEEGMNQGKRIFKRMFVMFDACKKNWLGQCRPLISLDGCFLKGVCQGQLLTAVGKDGNDQVMPIAWAVVSKENKVNWRWFLCWLRQELELGDGCQFTIISNMQKGLIDAVQLILPMAEHRWCARHVYANWSKKWNGGELKKKFSRCSSYMVDNNISESFNSTLVDARHKPIVSMLEEIRFNAMARIRDRKKMCDSWFNEWSPAAMRMYQNNKNSAVGCKVLFNGSSGYEIGEGEDKHTLCLDRKICTCRAWELTGIPCMHAISAMYYSKIDPLSMISKWYHKSTYQKAYEHPILPFPGPKFFKIEEYAPIEPPPFYKMPGRPRKKRVRASNEPGLSNKYSKRGKAQECSICSKTGHNKVRCPNKGNQIPESITTMPKKLQTRRRKNFVGIGCHVDLNSGKTTINPGLASQRVVQEAEQSIPQESDPIIRFPIPNEREINRNKAKQLCSPSNFRTIKFKGNGSEVRMPMDLPFKPPGLKWKEGPAVTTRQLLEQRDIRKNGKCSKDGSSTLSNEDHN